jgi:hypothetical protein
MPGRARPARHTAHCDGDAGIESSQFVDVDDGRGAAADDGTEIGEVGDGDDDNVFKDDEDDVDSKEGGVAFAGVNAESNGSCFNFAAGECGEELLAAACAGDASRATSFASSSTSSSGVGDGDGDGVGVAAK